MSHPAITLLWYSVGATVALGTAVAFLRVVHSLLVARAEANSDPLTSLPNRRAAASWLRHRLHSGQCLAVAVLDLDLFKQVNDRHGHATGDRLLTVVGYRLWLSTSTDTLVARLGGDEFLVAVQLRHATDISQAVRAVSAIVAALADPVATAGGGYLWPRASVGVAIISAYAFDDLPRRHRGAAREQHAETWRQHVARADAALGRAKGLGGGLVLGYNRVLDGAVEQITERPKLRRRDRRPGRPRHLQ
jgi:diguanylate cyclase (GGDEF)-like protein